MRIKKYMTDYLLFIDGSVNPQSKIGFGAYLIIQQMHLENLTKIEGQRKISITKFEETSSSRLEVQVLLKALDDLLTISLDSAYFTVTIYTDSQNIESLPDRQKKLLKNNFKTCNQSELKNADIYEKFYKLTTRINYKIIKLEGHSKSDKKSKVDEVFQFVDRASRKALRIYLKNNFISG